jgi:hypothetical protein
VNTKPTISEVSPSGRWALDAEVHQDGRLTPDLPVVNRGAKMHTPLESP